MEKWTMTRGCLADDSRHILVVEYNLRINTSNGNEYTGTTSWI